MNGKTEIWESVEEFRQKHLGDLGKVPGSGVRERFPHLTQAGGCDCRSMPRQEPLSGCGTLDRFLGKGNWLIQNLKPFPDPVSVRIHRPAQLVGDAPEGAA
jgi:hypothetical protein